MQQAIDNFEKSVIDSEAKLDNIEWMIKELNKAALSPDDNNLLDLVKSTRQVKNSYDELIRDMEEKRIQHRDFVDDLQDTVSKLQRQFINLKNSIPKDL